jgi:hypothetical protein
LIADIRDSERLTHEDVVGLNFVRPNTPYLFRRHYRTGLRSHIMAVVRQQDAALEREGIVSEGLRVYPKARPVKMLRIFRRRFSGLSQAEEELRGVKIVEGYLAPDYMAVSDEFLAELKTERGTEMILCGLQEFVEGEMIDPWGSVDDESIAKLMIRLVPPFTAEEMKCDTALLVKKVRTEACLFADRLKRMAREAGRITDLAGVGNLLLTPSGRIKLVDINNISRIVLGGPISLDDRGYPVCDKSVEALWLIECNLGGRRPDRSDPLYSAYLDPVRMEEVKGLERRFHAAQAGEAPFTGAQ